MLCYICNISKGSRINVPYINEDDESTGVTSLFICGSCWQKAGRNITFPMIINPEIVSYAVEEDHIVSSILKSIILQDESHVSNQIIPVVLHPEFIGVCNKCDNTRGQERQVPWMMRGIFTMFETVLCQDCWRALLMMPGSMPFHGDTWWDAFQNLREIDIYNDLVEEELESTRAKEKERPGLDP